MSQVHTHLGPPHSVAEALTTGGAEMATGSMVSELLSTALCTRCDSCRKQNEGEQWAGASAAGSHVQGCNLGSGEGEAGAHVLAVDAAQERRRVVQAGLFLPQQKLRVQDRIHLHRDDGALERVCHRRGGSLKKPHDPRSLNIQHRYLLRPSRKIGNQLLLSIKTTGSY